MKPPFDTDFEYDEWYERERGNQVLDEFFGCAADEFVEREVYDED